MKKNLLMLSIALSVVLASCARKDVVTPGTPDDGKGKSVYVKLSQAEGYAEGPSLPSGYVVNLSTGFVIFTDDYLKIVNTLEIVPSHPVANQISASALRDGVTLANIRSTATAVSIVANPPAGLTVPSNGDFYEAFAGKKIDIESQATLLNATLTGTGTIIKNNDTYSALVILTPRVSRIELAGVTASSPITGYKLVGIFVDNFYTNTPYINSPLDSDLKTVSASDLMSAMPKAPYVLTPSLADYNSSGLGVFNSNVVAPTNGNVWGYTLFSTTTMPRIVLRLKDIDTGSGASSSEKYLTISGLKTTQGEGIYSLTPGYVYKIQASDLVFSESDLSSAPILAPKQVAVSISNMPWTVTEVKPSYGVKK